MGYITAYDLSENFAMRDALSIHFSSNCYPPVPQSMISTAQQAVIAVADGDIHRAIDLPEGVSWRGQSTVPAHEAVDALRLDAFVARLMDERGEPPMTWHI